MTVWFTSDLHFGHANVIWYCNRPFVDVEAMNDALVDNWNRVVKPGDEVWVVGDFAFAKPDAAAAIRKRLSGNVHLIRGNHDRDNVVKRCAFASVHDLHRIKVGEQNIVLCHYAMVVWEKSHYGSWMLYGHSHGSLPDRPNSLTIDVGVDAHGYRPISYEEVAAIMAKKTWKPVDGHGRED